MGSVNMILWWIDNDKVGSTDDESVEIRMIYNLSVESLTSTGKK